MQLTDRIFRGLYRRGVMLEQMKEPALSRTVKQMSPAEPSENPREVDGMTAQEIIEAAELADIVDETDGRPLAEKLREAENSGGMLLVDAIDDEPYVSSGRCSQRRSRRPPIGLMVESSTPSRVWRVSPSTRESSSRWRRVAAFMAMASAEVSLLIAVRCGSCCFWVSST